MMLDKKHLRQQAVSLLRQACSEYGILATSESQENYRRLWSRDAMIAGIAGLLAGDEEIISGFKDSIYTLAEFQHPYGMIPSNVLPNSSEPEISYGGLAGRVDATSWFLVGCCLYLSQYGNEKNRRKLQPNLLQALEIQDRWEFNGRGLLYTPLSGNWADEYPVQGHTLYDNCLRLWGLELYADLFDDDVRRNQAEIIRRKITLNFWPKPDQINDQHIYHSRLYKENASKDRKHFSCSIMPHGYNHRFDAAGNGLAILLNIADDEQIDKIQQYIYQIFTEIGSNLLPAFWPVITTDDPEWVKLKENYSYNFKNKPHHFHNGGIWPVWMGLFALGLSRKGNSAVAQQMLQSWMAVEDPEHLQFAEYIASDTLKTGGKKRLSFSASGLLFLLEARKDEFLFKLTT